MDLRKLRHAVALARHRNFTKAAEALNLTQSALSRSIQALEQECRLRLFDRNRNAVALTSDGREFIRHAQALLVKQAELRDMVRQAAHGDGGRVALGMAPLAAKTFLPPLMARMIDNPAFHAAVTIGGPRKLLPLLVDESIELCICTGREAVTHPRCETVPLATFPIGLVVRRGHPLAALASLAPADLDRYALLQTRSPDADAEFPGYGEDGLHRRPALAIEDYDVLLAITASTDAVWVTSPIAAREWIADGRVTALPISWLEEAPRACMTLHYLRGRTLSRTASGLIDLVRSLSASIDPMFLAPGAAPAPP